GNGARARRTSQVAGDEKRGQRVLDRTWLLWSVEGWDRMRRVLMGWAGPCWGAQAQFNNQFADRRAQMGGLRIEGLEAAMRPDRLYPVRTAEGYDFYAGQAAGSRQILAAVDARALLVVVFDANGDFRESHWWDLS